MKLSKQDALRTYAPETRNPATKVAELLSGHPSLDQLDVFYERTSHLAWPETWGDCPWPFASSVAYLIRNHVDPIGHVRAKMLEREDEEQSGGRSYSTRAIDQRELDALHALAAREPNETLTWGLSTPERDINALFEQWRTSGTEHDLLQPMIPGAELGDMAGRHYPHDLYIERLSPGHYTVMLGRRDWQSDNLRSLEIRLFRWAHDEGYFDPAPEPTPSMRNEIAP